VQQARTRIGQRLTSLVSTEIDRLEQLRSRPVLASPQTLVDVRADEVVRAVARGEELLARAVERAHTRVSELTAQLRALSPQGTLRRGYSIVQLPGGGVLREPDDAPAGVELVVTLEGGAVGAVSTGASSPGRSPSPAGAGQGPAVSSAR
jgi:exodeoxyribonuclease VII large subunit